MGFVSSLGLLWMQAAKQFNPIKESHLSRTCHKRRLKLLFSPKTSAQYDKAELPFQATRLSLADLKTRGFPPPPHSGFGFFWLFPYQA
jgi:hypothetical protein